jgi:hypothetical protein
LRGDQDVNLLEKSLEAFLELFEKPFGLPVSPSDDFYLDDIVDKIHAAIFSTSLIRSRLRTYGERTENGDQFFTNLFDLLRFDLRAIVIF